MPFMVLVLLLWLTLTNTGSSESINHVNTTNIPIQLFCGRNAPSNPLNFNENRDSSFNQLRLNLLSNRVLYGTSQDLTGGDSVFTLARCWNYLSVDECVACFDAAVSVLVSCPDGNGAYVLFDNCFVRYESFVDFYTNPHAEQDAGATQFISCGNQSASQLELTYNQTVSAFLLEIRDVTPKISNFYVASAKEITNANATVYAVAQCVESTNQTICETCMNIAYKKLDNCLPSTEGRFFDMACFVRYSETQFFNDNKITDITNVLKDNVIGNSVKVTIVASVIGGVALLLSILISCLLYRQRKKSKKTEQDDLEGAIRYNYKDLKLATDNFSEGNILGKGGFGEVYKAILGNKNIVAVKKLHGVHARAKTEFENEVKLISIIRHRNLLRLLGWSSEGSNLLLVLEYIPNGSLDKFLWGARKGTLDWTQRYEIIVGIAKGLAHLHDELHVKIVHRDIKSSNILLSDDFKPKIADFGLARLQREDQTHISTTGYAGTFGYTAPEYALLGVLSDKVDTYSFGVVILETISGRRSTEVVSGTDLLLENTWKLYEKKMHLNIIDEMLDLNQDEQEQVMKIIEIALLCTESPVSNRPTMSEVVLMLREGQLLGNRELTRPTNFVHNQDRRIHIGT
ncbi:cysteine-rich receptor-like protein kinase 2 isoform X2 [Rutidosis leptorrhynchoides]|uniref:cysteine-rich receptor-like protein kinase 2 isoform X2 n=1 Tax=Rutidosis leptorrhynchoides TaxID=125765 RepID=UPI003A98DA95